MLNFENYFFDFYSIIHNFRLLEAGFLVVLEYFNLHIWIQRGRNHGNQYPDHKFSKLRHFWTPLLLHIVSGDMALNRCLGDFGFFTICIIRLVNPFVPISSLLIRALHSGIVIFQRHISRIFWNREIYRDRSLIWINLRHEIYINLI